MKQCKEHSLQFVIWILLLHHRRIRFLNAINDLQQIFLQQYYGVKIALKNAEMADCPHSAPLTNNSLDDVLEALSVAHGLKVSRNSEGVYELSGGSCPN